MSFQGFGLNGFPPIVQSGGGSGTVTNFAAGILSPLFTTSVSNPTTSPDLTFTLTAQSSSTFLAGPSSGNSTAPTFRAITGNDISSALVAGSNISLANNGSEITISAAGILGISNNLAKRIFWNQPYLLGITNSFYSSGGDTVSIYNGPTDANANKTYNGNNVLVSINDTTNMATNGAVAYSGSTSLYTVDNGPFLSILAGTGSNTTSRRIWFGLTPSLSYTTDTPINGCWFRYSTSAGDTNWMCITADSSTQTIINSGIAPDTNLHEFQINYSSPGVAALFYIDGTLVGTSTTHLPTPGTAISWEASGTNLASQDVFIYLGRVYIEAF